MELGGSTLRQRSCQTDNPTLRANIVSPSLDSKRRLSKKALKIIRLEKKALKKVRLREKALKIIRLPEKSLEKVRLQRRLSKK